MSAERLATYLNDHLAGSVAAVGLLDGLIAGSGGTELESFLTGLRGEIEEDQTVLRDLLTRLDAGESRMRKAAAWLTEKAGEMKLRLDAGGAELRLLEALEMLALGVRGKEALWAALRTVAGSVPQLDGVDVAGLERRAQDQHARIEARRLAAARAALAG